MVPSPKEVAKVLSPERASRVAAEVENIKEAGTENATNEVGGFITKIIQTADLAEVKTKVGVLEGKQKIGKLTDKEASSLNRLVKLYSQRMSDVREEAQVIVEGIHTGTIDKATGLVKAKNLLHQKGEFLRTGSVDDRKLYAQLAEDLELAVHLIPEEDIIDSKEARKLVEFRHERMGELPAPGVVLDKAGVILEKHEEKMLEGTRRGLAGEVRKEEIVKASIEGYNPTKKRETFKGKQRIIDGDRRFFHMARKVTNPTNAIVFEEDVDYLVGGKYEQKVSGLGEDELNKELVAINEFNNMWRKIRNQEILDKVKKSGPSRVEVVLGEGSAKTKVDFVGNRRQRLEELMNFVTGSEIDRDLEIGWIEKVGKTTRAEAEEVWNRNKEWKDQYGSFEDQLDKLQGRMTKDWMKKGGSRSVKTEFVREGDEIPREMRVVAAMLTEETLPDGKTRMVLTEEGKRQQAHQKEWAKAYGDVAHEMGWDSRDDSNPRQRNKGDMARYMSRVLRRGMPDMDPNSPEMMSQMSMYDNLTPEAATAKAEQVFQNIMRTQESSRDPKNQMQSYQLYGLLGSEAIPGDVRDKIAASLALYDVRVFQSSAEDYEAWAGTASFLWKEAYEILEQDSTPLFEDALGKMVGVRFKEIQNSYELYTTSDKSSKQRRFWMDQINGGSTSPDLEARALNMRKFMAFETGKQMGMKVEMQEDGSLKIMTPLGEWQDKLGPNTDEASFFRLFGLNKNGTRRLSEKDGISRTEYDPSYNETNDYYLKSSWYFENVLGFSNITLRSVEVEQGGSDGKLWKWMPNILHKINGLGIFHYFHQKEMGLNPFLKKLEVLDSLWRSMFSWKIGEGKGVFTQKLAEEVGNVSGGDVAKEAKFWDWFKDSIMSSDHKKYGNGYMLPIGEIRDRAEKNASSFDISTFDWKNILKNRLRMTDQQLDGKNLTGQSGAKLFLEHFSFEALNYDSLDHATIKDFVKYSGVSNKYFTAAKAFVDYPSHKTFKGLWEVLSEYHGIRNNTERKFFEINMLFQRFTTEGAKYTTFKRKNGTEASEVWKVDANQSDPEHKFVREKKGYEVRANGIVTNKDGQVMYREGEISWWDGIDPFDGRPQARSPGARRGLPIKSWVVQRQEMYDSLREGVYSPEQFGFIMRRWRSKLWFDVDWGIDEKTFAEAFKRTIKENPASVLKLLYTIPRGVFADILRLTFLDIQEFLKPFNKEINKSFGTDILPA